jgi:hypothetical protein
VIKGPIAQTAVMEPQMFGERREAAGLLTKADAASNER